MTTINLTKRGNCHLILENNKKATLLLCFMNREFVLQKAREAITQRLSRDSCNQLKQVAWQYGIDRKISAAVENWLGEIKDKDFENFSTKVQANQWLNEWLSRLP
ncbi:MAG: hypothetical protein HC820_05170 [Hydrococcus sp. RM1_1_31]|nr:hypothetical protein [Hydrococcus sp. RM1_1_31]